MTYDPNANRRPLERENSGYMGWMIGALALLAVIGVMFYVFSDNTGTQTATDAQNNRPVVTGPSSTGTATTGSGAAITGPAATRSGAATTAPAPTTGSGATGTATTPPANR